ncbi:MAG TPA: hypothetical protein VGN90_15290 [Pyrinomonadaceae bacterium]|nr:hypothetical protein [Pyrinomonadaceae bacterium]
MSTESSVNKFVFRPRDLPDLPWAYWLQKLGRGAVLSMLIALLIGTAAAQAPYQSRHGDNVYVIEGTSDTIVYTVGRSLRINGEARNGAFALGGDVIVQGVVEGDVAAVGGSVILLEGARIGGDVMVIGGTYHAMDKTPNRNPASQTIMYAGYEQELGNMFRNPIDLFAPHWTARYIGSRVLAILFWFIVSLGLTAAMPGTISRGVARLQLTSLRVAAIGFLGALAIGPGALLALRYLPTPISALVGLMTLLLILIAGVFGRVIIYAATGRWLHRKFFKSGKNSEAVDLLLGTVFWIALSSLPYLWPVVVSIVMVLSLGLALTARYRVGWKRREAV